MNEKVICSNHKLFRDYEILDTMECGIELTGTEVKSLRAGQGKIDEAYARVRNGQLTLVGAHIAPFEGGNRLNHEAKRTRKLLLLRSQIVDLGIRMKAKGMTIVPLRLYIDDRGHAKLELGIGRGTKLYDRRRDIAERDSRRDVERQLADVSRGR